jgi:hypothetical protein
MIPKSAVIAAIKAAVFTQLNMVDSHSDRRQSAPTCH